MILNLLGQETDREPMRSLMALAREAERRPGLLSVSLMAGFPYADVPAMGPSVIAVADGDRAAAQDVADELAGRMWEARRELFVPCPGPEEAVRLALASDRRPVVLVDLGDNVGGGSAGDGTVLLAELLRQRAAGAVVVLHDPDAVGAARQAGPGGRFERAVGGRVDRLHGDPVRGPGRGRSLHDGTWVEDQPRHGGRRFNDQGPTAVVTIDGPNTLVLNSLRTPPFSLGQLTSLGIDPARQAILVVKAAVAYKAAYGPIAGRVIEVDTPGLTAIDPARFTFRHIRQADVPARRLTRVPSRPESENPVAAERLRDRHPLGQRLADEVLAADLLLGQRDRLLGDALGDDHDAVVVGQDQVARVDEDAAAADRHVVPGDVEPPEAVGRMDAPAEDREAHRDDRPRVPRVAVDHHAAAAPIAGGGREQLAPEAPVALRDDHHVAGPEGVDGRHLPLVRLGRRELGGGHGPDRPRDAGRPRPGEQRPDLGPQGLLAVAQPVEHVGHTGV